MPSIDDPLISAFLDAAMDPLFWAAERQDSVSAWSGHIPFAHWLVVAARPGVFVELGTHAGVSYSAVCEAVLRSGTGTRCFAVDSWKGDEQAGFYDESVYLDLKQFHDKRYASFSGLLRMTFDEAVVRFDDGSIDLLHIDGAHGLEAVAHDFETWLPKLSERGVVIFHDTNERKEGFGVWRLWTKLRSRYPSFEFLHSHGLGVLCVGEQVPASVLSLCKVGNAEEIARVRERFQYLGERWATDRHARSLERDLSSKIARLNREKDAVLADALAAARQRAEAEKVTALAAARQRAEAEKVTAVNAARREVQANSWRLAVPIRAFKNLQEPLVRLPARHRQRRRERRDYEILKNSDWFDAVWYLKTYPDIAEAGVDPVMHYLRYGAMEGRDPGPKFATKLYLTQYPDVAQARQNPAAHFIRFGIFEGRNPHPQTNHTHDGNARKTEYVTGLAVHRNDAPTVLLCAHSAGEQLYGAERSFLDLLECVNAIGCNVVATIPSRVNTSYVDEIRKHASEIVCFPYQWWRKNTEVSEAIVTAFVEIIKRYSIDLVHVNTIMLREPHSAATQVGVPSVVHVRELIQHDTALCEFIGEPPEIIVQKVVGSTDYVFANSETSVLAFPKDGRTFVVPNAINVEDFNFPNTLGPNINVCLISSNIPKKGIYDFIEIAKSMQDVASARFLLVGPDNEHIARLRASQDAGEIPSNVVFPGYSETSAAALAQANIVLSLSHFQESFGRTVLEAMAARRPVVAYDWGAIPELIVDGDNGFLVPLGDTNAAVDRIRQLCSDAALMARMGEAGHKIAKAKYGKTSMAAQLRAAYEQILQVKRKVRLPTTSPIAPVNLRVSVIVPNFNYARYLAERISSIQKQSHRPFEIIFLDDASDDESLSVARELLSQSGIPFRVIANSTNSGTFRQWERGIAEANGDLIWIAEADDLCGSTFLETVLKKFEDTSVVLAYCRSKRIDENGALLSENSAHMDEVSPGKWLEDYIELGIREVVDTLAYRNTIPNVSACIFRRAAIREAAGTELRKFSYCGDWLFYSRLLRRGKIAYVAKSLNSFRRHQSGVTRTAGKRAPYLVELLQVREFICQNYPIHPNQLIRMNQFLDRDYQIVDVPRNSSYPKAKANFNRISTQISANRRFAFITTNNGSHNGGSEVLWKETALRLRQLGHDVVVLIKKWTPPPPFFDEFERSGVRFYFKEADGLSQVLAFRPDLTVISTGDQDEGVEYFKELSKRRLPYVIVNQLTKEERYWPIRERTTPDVMAGYLTSVKAFFTCKNNHRVMEERLGCSLPNWDIHYNPHHIDRDAVLPFPATIGEWKLAVPARILFIHKGQDLLLEVLGVEKWKRRKLTINFYGEGPDRQNLERMASERGIASFRFHGRVADIAAIWRENHGLVLPSRMEGLPIMLVSALLSARVAIVTDIGGHAEVIDDGATGFLAHSPTVDALDEALERAFAVRNDWEEIGRRGRQRILSWLPEDPVQDFVEKVLGLTNVPDHSTGMAEAEW